MVAHARPVPTLLDRAAALAARPGRALLGIAGAPGAGKSTLAARLAGAIEGAVVVPMDGFHLTTAALAAQGWVAERGTPRTFAGAAFVAKLVELRTAATVLAPGFDRTREEPVPDAIRVPAETPLVIVEGNYLLLDSPPWAQVKELLDEVWFAEVDEDVRLARLVARHVEFGRTWDEALQRATAGSDADNARLVAASRARADLVVDTAQWLG
jgi:pantothenate kinase